MIFLTQRFSKRETSEIPFIAHKFFGFELFYFLRAYIASAWCSKELNIGGNSLTQANYGNIGGKIKLIDSLKFYQRSLGELYSTLTEEEKNAVKKLSEKFFKPILLYLYYLAIFEDSKGRKNFKNYI